MPVCRSLLAQPWADTGGQHVNGGRRGLARATRVGSRLSQRWLIGLTSAALIAVGGVTAIATPAAADARTAVTSYDRMVSGAPHNGFFTSAWQSFVAQGDTITTVGVTVGTPNYVPDGHTVTVKLCTDTTCATTLASASPQIVNYGNTQVDLGDIGVTLAPSTTWFGISRLPGTVRPGQRSGGPVAHRSPPRIRCKRWCWATTVDR